LIDVVCGCWPDDDDDDDDDDDEVDNAGRSRNEMGSLESAA
jgi:hypothetical protein